MRKPVIAIDGPAGAGKSTVAKVLATRLGLKVLDTGAMYRALALKAQRAGLGPTDFVAAALLLQDTEIAFGDGDPAPVLLDGEDVSQAIRTLEIGELASALSVHPSIRQGLVERQQALVAAGGYILEGRDTTTVVAPDADVKVYLTATLDERAMRRHREIEAKNPPSDFGRVRETIAERDARDTGREESPLSVAPGALELDSTEMTVDEVVEAVIAALRAQGRDR